MSDTAEKSLVEKVGGVNAGHDLAEEFRDEVARLLGHHSRGFPGAQPVSFAARHIGELKRQDYYVCEKTDGIRYLMYMTSDTAPNGEPKDVHYLIDRKNQYWWVPGLHFPHQEDPTFQKFHENTVLDGELVEEKYPDGTREFKYWVFDCLVLDKQQMMQRPLSKRLAYFKENVMKPYNAMFEQFPQEKSERPFVVSDKSTQFSYGMELMFKEVIPKVKEQHGNDGLIFTCVNSPYVFGTDEHILKWKPPQDNTVDFLLHINWPIVHPEPNDPDQQSYEDYLAFPESFDLYVFEGDDRGTGSYRHFDSMYMTEQEWSKLQARGIELQDCVVECYLEPSTTNYSNGSNGNAHYGARWRLYRIRDDKEHGNFHKVVDSVMESIEDHITEDDLIRAAPDIRTKWKERAAAEKKR